MTFSMTFVSPLKILYKYSHMLSLFSSLYFDIRTDIKHLITDVCTVYGVRSLLRKMCCEVERRLLVLL